MKIKLTNHCKNIKFTILIWSIMSVIKKIKVWMSKYMSGLELRRFFFQNWRKEIQMWRKSVFGDSLSVKCSFLRISLFFFMYFSFPPICVYQSVCVSSITMCNRKSRIASVHTALTRLAPGYLWLHTINCYVTLGKANLLQWSIF